MNKAKLSALFASQFNEGPSFVIASPGRINLIGEHVDYNHGFVLPAAIDKYMYVAVSKRNDHQIVMHAADIQQNYQTSLDNALQRSNLDWPNYVLGVAHELKKDGHVVSGFNISFVILVLF